MRFKLLTIFPVLMFKSCIFPISSLNITVYLFLFIFIFLKFSELYDFSKLFIEVYLFKEIPDISLITLESNLFCKIIKF